METVDCSSTWGREQGSRRNCEVFGLRSARGQEREDRGSSDSLSRIAGDRDTVENRRAVGGRDADHGDCKCVVVYSGSRGDRGCEERLLRLSWEADSLWTLRMLTLLLECAKLRMLMAWWSTLGGAHSSLGESETLHAAEAGRISVKQLTLATDMSDPLLAAKCKIFAAFSLLQRGRLKAASKIIKQQYYYATQEAVTQDEKLVCMCQAAWVRLQTLKKLKKDSDIQEIN